MIRDLNKTDKIKYSKLFVEKSWRSFLTTWFFNSEGMFEDIDFYVAKTFWHEFTFKAKISGLICGVFILPFIFITFAMIIVLANVTGGGSKMIESNPIIVAIGRGIVYLVLIFPFSLIRFPFSLVSYFVFKKSALFYLLEVDCDSSSE